MTHKIAVFDHRLRPEARQQIQALSSKPIHFPDRLSTPEELIAGARDADIVLVSPWDKITKAVLDNCPRLRYLGLCGTSTANIDLDELKRRGIAFSNVVSHGKEPVAEYFFMQLVALARGMGEYRWRDEPRELMGKRIGVLGLGHVGQAIAHLALAYKMDVNYFSPHRKPEWEQKGVNFREKPELISSCEIIVVCSPTNVQVLGQKEFVALSPGSILVQASGGTPFDKPAFFEWIARDGNFAIFDKSAGLANFEEYRKLPRVIAAEAVAGDTYEANERRGHKIVANLKAQWAD